MPPCRGPNGIWTLRKKKKPLPDLQTPFEHARPSFTHMVRVFGAACLPVNSDCLLQCCPIWCILCCHLRP